MENNYQTTNQIPGFQQEAPNAIAVLILGIVSILLSCGYGIGFIPAIISLVLSSSAQRELKMNPNAYTDSSIKNIKAGRITAFVGLGLSIFLFIIIVFFVGAAVFLEGFH
jgi:hypothetical protein